MSDLRACSEFSTYYLLFESEQVNANLHRIIVAISIDNICQLLQSHTNRR